MILNASSIHQTVYCISCIAFTSNVCLLYRPTILLQTLQSIAALQCAQPEPSYANLHKLFLQTVSKLLDRAICSYFTLLIIRTDYRWFSLCGRMCVPENDCFFNVPDSANQFTDFLTILIGIQSVVGFHPRIKTFDCDDRLS